MLYFLMNLLIAVELNHHNRFRFQSVDWLTCGLIEGYQLATHASRGKEPRAAHSVTIMF